MADNKALIELVVETEKALREFDKMDREFRTAVRNMESALERGLGPADEEFEELRREVVKTADALEKTGRSGANAMRQLSGRAEVAESDIEAIERSTDEARSALDRYQKEGQSGLGGLSASFTKLGGVIAGVSAAITAIGIGRLLGKINQQVQESIALFSKQRDAIAQVEQGVESTGAVAGFSAQQLQGMATELQAVSTFGDEEILRDGIAQLLTFTNVAGEQVPRALQAMLDVAVRTQQDLRSTAIQLGKALNDPIANLGALGRTGIQFSESQKELIKGLAETGEIAKAQAIILGELETQYGGSARAAREEFGGSLEAARNQVGDLKEEIGEALVPALQQFVETATRFVSTQGDLLVGVFVELGKALEVVASAFDVTVGVLETGLEHLDDMGLSVKELTRIMLTFLGPLGNVVTFMSAYADLNERIVGALGLSSESTSELGERTKDLATSLEFVRRMREEEAAAAEETIRQRIEEAAAAEEAGSFEAFAAEQKERRAAAAEEAAEAERDHADATEEATEAAEEQVETQVRQEASSKAVSDAAERLTEQQQRLAQATREVAEAERELRAAREGVEDVEDRLQTERDTLRELEQQEELRLLTLEETEKIAQAKRNIRDLERELTEEKLEQAKAEEQLDAARDDARAQQLREEKEELEELREVTEEYLEVATELEVKLKSIDKLINERIGTAGVESLENVNRTFSGTIALCEELQACLARVA